MAAETSVELSLLSIFAGLQALVCRRWYVGWTFMSVALPGNVANGKYLNKRCEGHEEDHAQVRGKDGKMSENYTKELVEEVSNCIFEERSIPSIKPFKKPFKEGELEAHKGRGHIPFDSRCKDCLLGGMKDRPHYRRDQYQRAENTLAVDVAGRFKNRPWPRRKWI